MIYVILSINKILKRKGVIRRGDLSSNGGDAFW